MSADKLEAVQGVEKRKWVRETHEFTTRLAAEVQAAEGPDLNLPALKRLLLPVARRLRNLDARLDRLEELELEGRMEVLAALEELHPDEPSPDETVEAPAFEERPPKRRIWSRWRWSWRRSG